MASTRIILLAIVAAAVSGTMVTARAAAPTTVAPFRLQDPQGNWHALPDAQANKLVVIAFLGTECPLADLYASILGELARTYESKGVAFLGIDANQQDAPSALARFAKLHDLPFPLLKDVGN